MANPSFRASAKTTNTPLGTDNSGGALNVATHLPDDLLVLFLCVGSNTTSVPTPTVAGWTLRESYTVDVTGGSSDIGLFIYTKRAASGSESATLSLSANAAWIAHILSYANASYETTSTPNTYPNNPNGLYDPTQPTWGPYTNSVYQVPWAAITTGIFGITYPSGYTQITEDDGVGTNGDEIGLKVVQKLVSTPEDPSTFGANFDIGGLAATTVIRSSDDDPVQQGYCPKHMKGCCQRTCDVELDGFDRPDSTDLGPKWDEIGGDHARILNNQLDFTQEGLVICTKRQQAPYVPGAKFNLEINVDLIEDPSVSEYHIICGYSDPDNFKWVRIYQVSTIWYPQLISRSSGVDTVLMDITTHPEGSSFDFSNGVMNIQICFAEVEWSVQWTQAEGKWQLCDGGLDSLPANTNHGLVGFKDGRFDNFDYNVHWESDRECQSCTCFCYINNLDYKCLPETMTLTLVPTSGPFCWDAGGGEQCCDPPTGATVTLHQKVPDNSDPDLPDFTNKETPNKRFWYSDVIFEGGPVPMPDKLWAVLTCDLEYDRIYISFLCYPQLLNPFIPSSGCGSGAGQFASPDVIIAQPNSKFFDVSLSTCEPLNLVFDDIQFPRSAFSQCIDGNPLTSYGVNGVTYRPVVTL